MLLKLNAIYAEFIDNFLTIIQDEEEKNKATLVSGFLRARILSSKIGIDNSAVSLSAVMKSGLVSQEGRFESAENDEKAKHAVFTFDKARTQAQLVRVDFDCSQWTEMQQLTMVAVIQEAMNRIVATSLKPYLANLQHITDLEHQMLLRQLLQEMDVSALKQIAKQIHFNHGTLSLSPESLVLLNRKRHIFLTLAASEPALNIADDAFIAAENPVPALLSLSQQILFLDELLPALVLDASVLSQEEEQEQEIKLQLLLLYGKILAGTKENLWQVKAQWMRPGDSVSVGSNEVKLPASVSEIMNIISVELSKKHNANYKDALTRVRAVAQQYEQDWYTWIRNQLPYVAASAALKEFLKGVLNISVDGASSSSSLKGQASGCFFQSKNPQHEPLEAEQKKPQA